MTLGALRDPSGTESVWRRNRVRLGFPQLKSNGLRKTCATLLDTAGLSARAIGEYPRRAKPSMTQDVSMSRNVGSAKNAAISRVLPGSRSISKSETRLIR